jgi:2-oxopent-4-enoate hydratase
VTPASRLRAQSPDVTGGPRSIGAETAQRLGRELRDRELRAEPGPLISAAHPDMSLWDAYAIQKAYAAVGVAEGRRPVGQKVGATNPVIQRLFGVDQPDYGVLFDDMVLPDGARVAAKALIQPRVETEVAFLLAEHVAGPGATASSVLAATRGLVPCFEIIDSRFFDWKFTVFDTIADNGSSARVVLGNALVSPAHIELATMGAVLERNGDVADTGAGAAVLGHPAASVAWLANALARHGDRLEAGSLVLSGAITTAVQAAAGDHFEASLAGLGRVHCRFI